MQNKAKEAWDENRLPLIADVFSGEAPVAVPFIHCTFASYHKAIPPPLDFMIMYRMVIVVVVDESGHPLCIKC